MLSLILLLVLVGIAAYFRSPAWLISLAAVVGLALGGAALAAVGHKFLRQHAQRLAGAAAVAIGAVGEQPAAPKALSD